MTAFLLSAGNGSTPVRVPIHRLRREPYPARYIRSWWFSAAPYSAANKRAIPVPIEELPYSAAERIRLARVRRIFSGIFYVRYTIDTSSQLRGIFDMVNLTETAVSKVKEILDSQEPKPAGLRISVVGGGCSGFSYSMAFENAPNMLDKTYNYSGLKVFIDQASLLYLDGAEVDYIETLEGSGFKFNNPQVKSTCGCGSSFSV